MSDTNNHDKNFFFLNTKYNPIIPHAKPKFSCIFTFKRFDVVFKLRWISCEYYNFFFELFLDDKIQA